MSGFCLKVWTNQLLKSTWWFSNSSTNRIWTVDFSPEIEGRTSSIEFDNIECMDCVVIRSIYLSNWHLHIWHNFDIFWKSVCFSYTPFTVLLGLFKYSLTLFTFFIYSVNVVTSMNNFSKTQKIQRCFYV